MNKYVLFAVTLAVSAQRVYTAADYAQAEKFMGYNVNSLVFQNAVRPNWLPDGRFWYRNTLAEGAEFVIVDPERGTRLPVFDHAKMASALSKAAGAVLSAKALPFQEIELDGGDVLFNAAGKRWKCDLAANECLSQGNAPGGGGRGRGGRGGGGIAARNDAQSPDKKHTVFIRDWNLWMREAGSNKETQLTFDGVKDYGYATDNAGWTNSDRPIVVWSPDSKKIATFQQDQRQVGEMYLVSTKVGHPELRAWKYPLPGDEHIPMIERVIIDIEGPKVTRLKMPPDQHRSTLCDHIACRGGEWSDVEWSADSAHLAFVSTSRGHREEKMHIADAATGDVRDVFEETVETFFESGNGRVNWRYLAATNEFIWFSERDNWGHLYLYDANTGKVKNQIVRGEGNVTQVLDVNETTRTIVYLGVGREKGHDPYFIHLYSIGFDGNNARLLTPENANHELSLSPGGRYFTDTFSTMDTPQVSVLRDMAGRLITTLEHADISKLLATGWKPPIPITVKARDGQTDLYGVMFKPTNFDASRRYPIINHIYPGPQTGSVGSRSFSAVRGDTQALAELGFVVVEIDGMGTPWRSKKFHEAYYGDMGDNTLPDQVAGMKELARRYPWIDIERAGIYGHSGGGYAAAGAMFHFPDFFKVGISEAGNHDNREYEDDWGEKWQGLLDKKGGGDNYDSQANQNFAKNLKGKLLLAHGTMDNNVPPTNTLLVVDALIKANKDFDLLLLPNRNHGFGNEPYMVRRRWDYFVKNLAGGEPPKNYELHAPQQGRPE